MKLGTIRLHQQDNDRDRNLRKDREDAMGDFLLVKASCAPETLVKVLAVKERLQLNPRLSVNQACKDENLSRSAFYKYRHQVYRALQQKSLVGLWVRGEWSNDFSLQCLQEMVDNRIRCVRFQEDCLACGEKLLTMVLEAQDALELKKVQRTIEKWSGVLTVQVLSLNHPEG